MDWYYVVQNKREGPVSEEEFQALADTGVIGPEDLVWRSGMTGWQRYGDVGAQSEAGRIQTEQEVQEGHDKCVECGGRFPDDEMVHYGGSRICAACKPIFFQRIKEGAPLPARTYYGGFWIRLAAKFIDWFIVGIANSVIQFGFLGAMSMALEPGERPGRVFFLIWFLMMVVQFAVALSYSTFFVGKFAATPGKMACGLKIVTSEGGKVSYLRALARYFAEILSGIILAIGYIIAAFDEEKRTLHDHICDTRVIRKQATA